MNDRDGNGDREHIPAMICLPWIGEDGRIDVELLLTGIKGDNGIHLAGEQLVHFLKYQGISEEKVQDILLEWNLRNEKPLDGRTLKHIVKTHMHCGGNPHGYTWKQDPYSWKLDGDGLVKQEKPTKGPADYAREAESEGWAKIDPDEAKVLKISYAGLARHLLKEHDRYITLRDSQETLFYQGGVYRPGGEQHAREAIYSHLRPIQMENKNKVSEVLHALKLETGVDRDELDKDKHIINVKNGLLDIRNRMLIEHTPDYRSVVQIPVEFHPDAECPAIRRFLSEVVAADDIPAFEEFVGYCFYPGYPVQRAFMLYGQHGENGKSTALALIKRLLGESNYCSVSMQQLAGNRYAAAELFGKMACIYADLSPRALRDTGLFKMLTGGDTIPAERKYQQPFQFVNSAKLIYSANRLPETSDESGAFFRRWVIINFPNSFPEGSEKRDGALLEKLTTPGELSGLLNLALDGLKRIEKNGWRFTGSKTAEEVQRQYVRLSNPLKAFVVDCVTPDPDGFVTKADFYDAYRQYCQENRLSIESKDAVGKHLPMIREFAGRGGQKKLGGKNVKVWIGVTISHESLNSYEGNRCSNSLKKTGYLENQEQETLSSEKVTGTAFIVENARELKKSVCTKAEEIEEVKEKEDKVNITIKENTGYHCDNPLTVEGRPIPVSPEKEGVTGRNHTGYLPVTSNSPSRSHQDGQLPQCILRYDDPKIREQAKNILDDCLRSWQREMFPNGINVGNFEEFLDGFCAEYEKRKEDVRSYAAGMFYLSMSGGEGEGEDGGR